MTTPQLSDKQWDFVLDSDAPINIAHGAVRSGKTFACLYRFAEYCVVGPPGELALTGKTASTIFRNVILPMMVMFGKRVRYNRGLGEVYFAGRTMFVIGANDVRAEEKLRGVTLAGGYCNELSLHPEDFFDQLIARCSIDESQIFADTNPDNPHHWLNKRFLANPDASGLVKSWHFELDDNPVLSAAYKERLTRLYTGLWFKRMVKGLWVQAEGSVFDMFDPDVHVVSHLPASTQDYIGVDYGTSNPTVFLHNQQGVDSRLYVAREWSHDSRAAMHQLTDAEYSKAYRAWAEQHGISPRWIFIDPSAASFHLQLRRDGVRNLTQADNTVLDGIRNMATLLTTGHLKIHESCEGLISEMTSYAWDPDKQKLGIDAPIKAFDHRIDSERYVINGTQHIWRRWLRAERKAA